VPHITKIGQCLQKLQRNKKSERFLEHGVDYHEETQRRLTATQTYSEYVSELSCQEIAARNRFHLDHPVAASYISLQKRKKSCTNHSKNNTTKQNAPKTKVRGFKNTMTKIKQTTWKQTGCKNHVIN